jgi:hypothetical protein
LGVFEPLVASSTGVRESAQSWQGLLLELKLAPELAVLDGALGFRQA